MSIDKFIEAEIRRQVEEEIDPVRRDIGEVGDEVETVDYNLIRLKERVSLLEDAQMKFSVGAIRAIVLQTLEEHLDVKVTLKEGGDK